jgi:hypothetical protein
MDEILGDRAVAFRNSTEKLARMLLDYLDGILNCVLPSYIVMDQKAFAGGNCPSGNLRV